jgi:hypothetical protein
MSTLVLPAWPKSQPRTFKPLANLRYGNEIKSYSRSDLAAIMAADGKRRTSESLRNSATTGTWTELLFRNKGDFTAMSTTGSETSFLSGQNQQPTIPALFFDQVPLRAIGILARGILTTTTGTPTFTFQARLGSTIGVSTLSGTSVGVSAAITSTTGVTNVWWEMRLDLVCTVAGQGSGNATLSGAGYVMSPAGFATPFVYPLEPTTPNTATWTATLDDSVTQYLNLSATLQATGAPALTCKQLLVFGFN